MRICDLIISTNIARILLRFILLQPQEGALQLVSWKFLNISNIRGDMGSERLGSGTPRASAGLKPTHCFSFVLGTTARQETLVLAGKCWILICYLQIYLLPLSVAVSSSPWGKRVSTSLLPAMVPAKEKQWSPWWLVTGGPLATHWPPTWWWLMNGWWWPSGHAPVCPSSVSNSTRPTIASYFQHTPAGQSNQHVASNNTENHSDRRDTKTPVYTCRNI